MDRTSLSLLDRLQHEQRDEDWTRLILIYKPFIQRFIKLDKAVAPDAEDICQEVMRKVVLNLPRFKRIRDGSFRLWLKTITVNEVNFYWRQRLARRGRHSPSEHLAIQSLADPRHELSQRWDREHDSHLLRSLQDLVRPEFSETTWRAFELRVFEEKSTHETAQILQVSKNAVDIAKSRVLARMRKEAGGFLD